MNCVIANNLPEVHLQHLSRAQLGNCCSLKLVALMYIHILFVTFVIFVFKGAALELGSGGGLSFCNFVVATEL